MMGFARSTLVLKLLPLIILTSCQSPMTKVPTATWTPTHFTAPDGTEFPYSKWLPQRSPSAVILCIHGLGGAASDWRPLGEYFRERGIAVYAHELRGMGNDPQGPRVGDLDHPQGWFEDFSSFALRVQSVHPGVPIFWYGESLGGIIGAHLSGKASALGLRLSGFILASPIVQITGKLTVWQTCLLKLGSWIAPTYRLNLQSLASNGSPPAQVVSSTSHEAQLEHTPHAVNRFSLRLLQRIGTLVKANRTLVKKNSRPILVLYAGNDIFTKPEEVEQFFGEIGGNHKEKRFYPEGYHLLLHDVSSDDILADIEMWLEKYLENGA